LQPSTGAPFEPTLSAAPNHFTIALTFTNTGISASQSLAIDGQGKVWATDAGDDIVKLKSLGAPLSHASSYTNSNLNGLWETSGSPLPPVSFSISLNSSGTAVAGSPFAAGILNPGPVAVGASGDIWALSPNNANRGVVTGVGSPVAGTPYNTSSSTNASNFAFDGIGNAWIVTRTSSSDPLNPFFYQIAGISNSGNVLSGSSGYALDNNVQHVKAIAVDGSGNIWLDTSASLTELIGVAAPVITPVVTAAVTNTLLQGPDSGMSMIEREVSSSEGTDFGKLRSLVRLLFPCNMITKIRER
jgi:hypothetical protein